MENELRAIKNDIECLRLNSAEVGINKLLKSYPSDIDLLVVKLHILHAESKHEEIISTIKSIIVLDPNNIAAHDTHIQTLIDLGHLPEARHLLETKLSIKMSEERRNYLDFHLNYSEKNWDRVVQIGRKIIAEADDIAVSSRMMMAASKACMFDEHQNLSKSVLSSIRNDSLAIEPLHLLTISDEPSLILSNNKRYSQNNDKAAIIAKNSGQNDCPEKDQKIKIGYFSPDFGNHPITHLISGLIRGHNRLRYEIIGINIGPRREDKYTRRITKEFDIFYDYRRESGEAIANLSRKMGIDIAVDLCGHTAFHKSSLFYNRAAPIQINYLGTPCTLGTSVHDYIITDDYIEDSPEGSVYSEKPLVLSGGFQCNDDSKYVVRRVYNKSDFGIDSNQFVFGCFSSPQKINKSLLQAWIRILLSVDNSVIFLYIIGENSRARMTSYFSEYGIEPRRIIYAEKLAYEAHLERYAVCDLVLDTHPFCGGATASDALWAGVPLLSISGKSFSSRMSSSLLYYLDLNELITESLQSYSEVAITLARNPAALLSISEKIEERRGKFFNSKDFVQRFESGIESILSC